MSKIKKTAQYYVQQEIKGIIDHEIDTGDMERAFIAGAEWQKEQSPWISVKDALPKERTGVFFIVKWGTNSNGYFVGLYNGNGYFESDYRIFPPDSQLWKVTHWMPIVEAK